MDALIAADEEQIAAIDGFGGIMAQEVYAFFRRHSAIELIDRLKAAGVNMTAEAVTTDTKFLGKTFVLTGTLPNLKRTEAAALIEKAGGKVERLGLEKDELCCGGRRSRQQAYEGADAGHPRIDGSRAFDAFKR